MDSFAPSALSGGYNSLLWERHMGGMGLSMAQDCSNQPKNSGILETVGCRDLCSIQGNSFSIASARGRDKSCGVQRRSEYRRTSRWTAE